MRRVGSDAAVFQRRVRAPLDTIRGHLPEWQGVGGVRGGLREDGTPPATP